MNPVKCHSPKVCDKHLEKTTRLLEPFYLRIPLMDVDMLLGQLMPSQACGLWSDYKRI